MIFVKQSNTNSITNTYKSKILKTVKLIIRLSALTDVLCALPQLRCDCNLWFVSNRKWDKLSTQPLTELSVDLCVCMSGFLYLCTFVLFSLSFFSYISVRKWDKLSIHLLHDLCGFLSPEIEWPETWSSTSSWESIKSGICNKKFLCG